jgi:hypothetical protein
MQLHIVEKRLRTSRKSMNYANVMITATLAEICNNFICRSFAIVELPVPKYFIFRLHAAE